jgi:NitT/TauT family transport system ATP-binding protein
MTGRVEIDDVSIRFADPQRREITALTPMDLSLPAGSFTALIGPSGCGKSTLLNSIAGFVLPTTGAIRVDERQVTAPDPEVGVVFQQYALFPWFTAIGNVQFALKRFSLSRAERREQAMAALEEVGLADRASAYPGQLSGGMKQRVAIARTFASKPKVLLMDEPFGALDAQTRVTMHELLLRIWDRHRTTVLFVTHDVDEALLLSDKVHVMSAGPGKIIASIDVETARPRSVDMIDEAFLANRNKIMKLLRRTETDSANVFKGG